MGSEDEKEEAAPAVLNIAVVMVPLPAQGHLNSFLNLASRIASRRIHVHFVGAATHNRQARARFHDRNLVASASASHFHFHDLPFPPIPSPTPDPLVNFPAHLQPSFDAVGSHLLPHLSALLLSLASSHHRVVLLHDASMSFSADAATPIVNAEAFAFHPTAAMANLFFLRQDDPSLTSDMSDEFLNFIMLQRPLYSRSVGRLFNTCRDIESTFLDQLGEMPLIRGQRLFAVGPLNPTVVDGRSEEECLGWLDGQPPASVLYVSFGTTSTLPREQLRELGAGLEASGQRFIWVRRDADRCDIFESGDEGKEDFDLLEFRKRVEGRGRVVTGWAPQLEILKHPSTGGFLSHCGWNSCMEAMSSGVPILAWPMHSDQPVNSMLVTQVLMAGIAVKKWAEKDEVVAAEVVKESVLRLMAGGGEGEEVRRRAREIGGKLRAAVMEGGSSKEDLNEFLAYVCRP